MRALWMCLIGGLSLCAAAACDSSSTSSSSGGFTFDGGDYKYQAPDSGTPTGYEAGAPDGSSSGSPDSGSGPCTVTLSGGLSKTLTCTLSAAFDSQNNTSGLAVTTPAFMMNVPEATFALEVNGELAATTYAWGDSVKQGGTIYEGGSSAWTVDSSNAKGTSTVTVSSVNTLASVSNGKVYAVHGTVTATLVAEADAGADVTMTVTF